MVSLIDIRNTLALAGILNVNQISLRLKTPQPLVQAMLDQLIAMRKVEAIEQDDSCLSGSCKSCPEGKKCLTTSYRLCNS